MNLEQLADKYLPYTKEERNCAIKKAQKQALRDAFKYDIGKYAAEQLKRIADASNAK